jgi:hypothetical protein
MYAPYKININKFYFIYKININKFYFIYKININKFYFILMSPRFCYSILHIRTMSHSKKKNRLF